MPLGWKEATITDVCQFPVVVVGIDGFPVEVEVDLSRASFLDLVGLADTVKEAKTGAGRDRRGLLFRPSDRG